MKTGDVLGGAALLTALTVGGVLLWREVSNTAEAQRLQLPTPGTVATPPTPGAPPVLAVPTPHGTAPSPAPGAFPGAATSADLAAVQRQNQIDTLRRDLARVWNDIDVQLVQARTIKSEPVPPAFSSAVIDKVWADCKAQHKLFPTTQCLQAGTDEKAKAAVGPAWEADKARRLEPIQAQLSRLNAEQLALIQNLGALGYQVPAGQQRSVTT